MNPSKFLRLSSRAGSLCLFGLSPIATIGCLRIAPKMSKPVASMAPVLYSQKDLEMDLTSYRVSVAGGSKDTAKTQRNRIVFRVMAQVDAAYGNFELNLSTRRAGAQAAGDAAQLGLTAAATVVGASAVKDILSATSTALQGTRLSFDKNFFEQKTTEALVSQMRASRKTLEAQILLSLSNRDTDNYPLEAAWIDVVKYYYAGTIPSALVDISSKAGSDASDADKNLQKVVKELTPATPAQAAQAVSIRTEYERLKKDIASKNAETVKTAGQIMSRIFTAAGIGFDTNASPPELLTGFMQAMRAANEDDDKLKALNEAVASVTKP